LQAAGDLDDAALLAADLDHLLFRLAVGDQINHLAGRPQNDRLLRYGHRVLLLAGDDGRVDRTTRLQGAGVVDAGDDVDGAVAFANGRADVLDHGLDAGVR